MICAAQGWVRRWLAAAAMLAAALTVTVPAARAETSADAQARVHAVLARVAQLRAEVARAEQDYADRLHAVAAAVNDAVLADQRGDVLNGETTVAQDALAARVRALYIAGGPVAIYASMLQTGGIADFQSRLAIVNSVVQVQRDVVRRARAATLVARARASALASQSEHQIATERDVAAAAVRVQQLLAAQQRLLATAQAHLAQVREVEAARAALAAQATAFSTITTTGVQALRVLSPSPEYLALYHRAAATCPGLSWTVLAAIGQVESGHGRNPSTSSAGAMGPMQFLPSTFTAYGVDGDHNGALDIMAPADAIYTAARYLCANGAGRGGPALANAIFRYNHADWYVQMVLTLAQQYAG